MKNLSRKQLFQFAAIAAVAFLATNPAIAAEGSPLIGMLTASNSKLIPGITAGFAIFAAVKWIDYFASFSVDSALTKAIVPAMLTFLTFQWQKVLPILLPGS